MDDQNPDSPGRERLREKSSERMAKKADKRTEKQRREGNTMIPKGGVVTLKIPIYDRGKTDARRLPGVVTGNTFFKVNKC